ncbi:MAG TPA: hypothetical protein V6D17_06865 [Candidatus Obscuribacterales bacterium]
MPTDPPKESIVTEEKADELVELLTTARFEDFIALFRAAAQGHGDDGSVLLAEAVNEHLVRKIPDCSVKLVVSQKTEGKHIIMITDSSRFFGAGWTISKQMFVV